MKFCKPLFAALLGASFLLLGSLSHADELVSTPVVKAQGATSYVSGGVTIDERDAMKPIAKDYNLRMSFSLNVGNYVSDVKVKITSGKKIVLDVVSDGPWLYVKLPAGKYAISADYEGKIINKHARIAAKKGSALSFVWPGVKEKYDE